VKSIVHVAVVARAADDAEAGDHRARQWLGQYLIVDHKMTNVDVTAEKGITVLEVDDWYGNREALDRGIEKQKISHEYTSKSR
jgi:hypothetical protein